MKRCFVYCAGTFYEEYEKPQKNDFIIAADAGYALCKKLSYQPDLVIGDFDSIAKPNNEHCICVPVKKDDTDTMLALREGLKNGCTEFYLYGATGGSRLDHTLANLQSLAFLRRNGARGYVYDRRFVYTVIENETFRIKKTVDHGIVSMFSMSDAVTGLTLKGLEYPLCGHTLTNRFPLCVSNHFHAQTATVIAASGLLLLGWELGANAVDKMKHSADNEEKAKGTK